MVALSRKGGGRVERVTATTVPSLLGGPTVSPSPTCRSTITEEPALVELGRGVGAGLEGGELGRGVGTGLVGGELG